MRKKKLGLVIVFIATFFFLLTLMCYYHEIIHKQIYATEGIDSEIVLDWRDGGSLGVVPDPHRLGSCDDLCQLAHLQNNIVTYPLIFILTLIYFGFLFVLLNQKEETQNEKPI